MSGETDRQKARRILNSVNPTVADQEWLDAYVGPGRPGIPERTPDQLEALKAHLTSEEFARGLERASQIVERHGGLFPSPLYHGGVLPSPGKLAQEALDRVAALEERVVELEALVDTVKQWVLDLEGRK